ncbi:MAG: FAD-dependent monooxygenase [bacterium]
MPSSVVDVVVIGAGPAGAAAARLLASWGRSVVIVGRSPSRRQLAESLPPSCAKLLERVGVRSAVDSAGFIRATGNTVKWAGGDTRAEFFDAGTYGYQVSRAEFDGVLLSAAENARATVYRDATVRDVERTADDWSVAFDAGDARHTVSSRWVLDCSGRSGVVARRGWRKAETSSRTTAVVGVWECPDAAVAHDPTHTLVESYDGGWAWSVPVAGGRRYVTVMLDPSVTDVPGKARLSDAYRTELMRTSMLRALVERCTLVETPWGCDASPYTADHATGDGALLVGDAASFVDPLSSFGVKKALASAWLAAVAVNTAIAEPAMTTHALALFEDRERAMYEHLQRQSAALSREAAGVHASAFWVGRSDVALDESFGEVDVAALRSDDRVLGAFEALKGRPSIALSASESLRVIERATVHGQRVVLERHLASPALPRGIRYCRNIDLLIIAQIAARYDQVPDLFDAYNRQAPPAPLPDFLGALSTLIGLGLLTLA